MPDADDLRPASPGWTGPRSFEPSATLTILDGLGGDGLPSPAGSAWDAAWIACLTGSTRWAETAWREFVRATGGAGSVDG